MSYQLIYDFLCNLPDEKARDYELKIAEFVLKNNTEAFVSTLTRILDSEESDSIRYNAFYCLNILYRRRKDFVLLDNLFNKYSKKFTRHISLDHLRALYMLESDAMYDYDTMLHMTYKDATIFDNNGGFLHLFSDVFATIYEKGGLDDEKGYCDEWYDFALECVNKAIALEETYAKYYCTKARILCISGNYHEAENLINKAISYENSDRSDYFLRISMYQYYKMMIYTNKRLALMKQEYEKKLSQKAQIEINKVLVEPCAKNEEKSEQIFEPYNGDKPFAFISYSRLDADYLHDVIDIMGNGDIRFWYDKGIPASCEFAEIIGEKIQNCSAFVLLISPNSMNSEFVRKELTFALNKKLKPICVFLKETELTPGFEIQISLYEHIYYYDMQKSEFSKKLLSCLNDYLK